MRLLSFVSIFLFVPLQASTPEPDYYPAPDSQGGWRSHEGMDRKKLDEVTAHHKQHQGRLNNPDFVAKAAPEMQEQMHQRAQELAAQQELLRKQLRLLEAN